MTLSESWRRLDGVDLLRGVAILFVLMNHVNMQLLFGHVPYTRGLPPQLVASLVWNGQYGVQMFFAVSGFLITATSLGRWGALREIAPREFYLLRFARIAPLLLLLLTVLSGLHLAHARHFVVGAEAGGLSSALVAALSFRINVLEAARGYLPGNWDILWSLSVEEMFYLFFPLACRVLRRTSMFVTVLGVFVVLGPFARTVWSSGNEVWHEYSYLGAMDAIALGCLTALVLSRVQMTQRQLQTAGIAGSAAVVFILGFSRSTACQALERLGLDMSMLALGTCMLIAVAAATRWRRSRWLAPLCAIGAHSYEVYLTHMFVVLAVFALFLEVGRPVALVPLLFLMVIALGGLLGAAVARWFAEPANRLLRRRFQAPVGSLNTPAPLSAGRGR